MRLILLAVVAAAAIADVFAVIPIEYLDPVHFDAKLNENVTISIDLTGNRENIGCELITPDGITLNITDEANYAGITKMNGNHISCGVIINVNSEEIIGQWILVADETNWGYNAGERRVNFTIAVEETVEAFPAVETAVTEGNDFYFRLAASTPLSDTCQVVGPHEEADSRAFKDEDKTENCGYVIKNVNAHDNGTWTIVYGQKIVYKAEIHLVVKANQKSSIDQVIATKDRSLNETLGPDNTIYCVLKTPTGRIHFNGFGQCNLVIDRVTDEDHGIWNMEIGLPGRVLMEEHQLTVIVQENEPKATVSTKVVGSYPVVTLSCTVTTTHDFKFCKFRNPTGTTLIANQGVGEGRYVFNGTGTSVSESGVYTHNCGLRMSSTDVADQGFWRCAIETDQEIYYGFLRVDENWMYTDMPNSYGIESEPKKVVALERESVILGCSVDAPIRYCYFRFGGNGTHGTPGAGSVFSVGPEMSTENYEYAGAGFDAGECAISFHKMAVGDTGSWSCHVGYMDTTLDENNVSIDVLIQPKMTVRQYINDNFLLQIQGQVYDSRPLDYCRFVRIDGFGFTSDLKDSYDITSVSDLETGFCGVTMPFPSILDHHPWTVVARIRGHHEEISAVTSHTIMRPIYSYSSFAVRYSLIIIIGISLLFFGILLIPTSRNWTYEKASRVNRSFRRSFRRSYYIPKGTEAQADMQKTPTAA